MNNKGIGILSFSIGAIVASIGTWYFTKKKYIAIMNEEIQLTRDAYAQMQKNLSEKNKVEKEKMSIEDLAVSNGYIVSKESEVKPENQIVEEKTIDIPEKTINELNKPYVIPPEEFGNLDDYNIVSFKWYSYNETLVDDYENIIEDYDDLIGKDSLSTFGLYDDDVVYVRNDNIKTDYEIISYEEEFEQ